jgi:hypothetical protein
MKRNITLFLLATGLLFMTTLAGAQEVYFVQSAKAKIMKTPSFKGGVVAILQRGHRLQMLAKEGSWIKVDFGAGQGYVAKLLVTNRPPMARLGLIKGDDELLSKNVRRRASTYTSAAAARGLATDDRRRLSAEQEVDYKSLERMEAFTVTEEDLASFQKGGVQ